MRRVKGVKVLEQSEGVKGVKVLEQSEGLEGP